MKASRCVLGAVLLGSLFLEGCGSGTYQVPNVPPVVKQKAGSSEEDNLLKDIENGDDSGDKKKDSDDKKSDAESK